MVRCVFLCDVVAWFAGFEVRTMYYPRFIEELFKPQDGDMNVGGWGCWFVFVYWNENI